MDGESLEDLINAMEKDNNERAMEEMLQQS
jgi:hypothetical protein